MKNIWAVDGGCELLCNLKSHVRRCVILKSMSKVVACLPRCLKPIKAGVVSRYRKTGGWLSQPPPLKNQMIYQFYNLRTLMRLIQYLFIFLILIGVNGLVKSIFLDVWIVYEIATFWHDTGANIESLSSKQWLDE